MQTSIGDRFHLLRAGDADCVQVRQRDVESIALRHDVSVRSESRGGKASPIRPGSKVVTTRKDFCGGGSVAPFVERRFSGSAAAVEDAYRQRMSQDGWQNVREVEAGGFGATKGERIVHVEVGQGVWTVFMQQGTEPARCDDLRRGEEVTSG